MLTDQAEGRLHRKIQLQKREVSYRLMDMIEKAEDGAEVDLVEIEKIAEFLGPNDQAVGRLDRSGLLKPVEE